MRRTLLVHAALGLCAAACGGIDETAGTLAPLSSSPTSQSAVAPSPVPHWAWYHSHRETIDQAVAAIRSFVAQLTAATDPFVLAMVCTKGVELDLDSYRAAYDARDAHPAWVPAVDLTRWMIASCHTDARQSVTEVMPKLDAALSEVEAWIAMVTAGEPADSTGVTVPGCC